MKKISVLFIILFTVFLFSCKSKTTKKHIKKTAENNLLEQTVPQKGELKLELEKVLSFDPSETNPDAINLGWMGKDKNGDYYFSFSKTGSILKYSPEGKYLKSFLKKGQGPGELPYISYFRILPEGVYVSSGRKLIKFDFAGDVVFEKSFKKRHGIEIVNDNEFVGTFDDVQKSDKQTVFKKAVGLMDINEKVLVKYFDTLKSGITIVRTGKGAIAFGISGVFPAIEWAYDRKNRIVYFGVSDKYKIYSVDLKGDKIGTFGKKDKERYRTNEEKIKISNMFKNMGKEIQKALIKKLPDKKLAFINMEVSPAGYLLVYDGDGNADVFDMKGNYIYRLLPPEGREMDEFTFFGGGYLGYLKETDNGDVFTEYRVKNPEDIF